MLPHIFDNSLLLSDYDDFWKEEKINILNPVRTLVLSLPIGVSSPEMEQLQKMMGACGQTSGDYRLLALEKEERLAWHRLREKIKPKIVLLLGVSPEQLGIRALFQVNEANSFDGVSWVPTVSLTELMQHSALKKHLWANVFQKIYLP